MKRTTRITIAGIVLCFLGVVFFMCIVICIIYVHDDVDVSAYEYVNVYADGYASVLVDWYMYVPMDM